MKIGIIQQACTADIQANKEKLASVMNHLAESLRQIAIMIEPFMPHTTPQIFAQLGIEGEASKL